MFNRRSIIYKYMRAFLIIIVLPIMVMSLGANNIYTKALIANASDKILQTLKQISLGINNEMSRTSVLSANLVFDDELLSLANQWGNTTDPITSYILSQQINKKIRSLFSYINGSETVSFYYKNKKTPYYYRKTPNLDNNEVKNTTWYKSAIANKGKVININSLNSALKDFGNNAFSFAESPDIPDFLNNVAVVYFSYKTNLFEDFFSKETEQDIGKLMIVDNTGEIMLAKDITYVGKNIKDFPYLELLQSHQNSSFTENIDDRKTLVTSYTIEKANWKIVNYTDYKNLTNQVIKITQYVFAISTALLLLFIIFSFSFFRDIIVPIKNLIKIMKRVEKGDFEASIKIKRDDEIYHLGAAFNNMVSHIKGLIIESNLKEKEKSKAEIEMLQSQITPHFITNTLNSIKIMARMSKQEQIVKITDAFMKLLSASFGKTGKLITATEEIENIKNYIYIMKIRYGEKFEVVYDINIAVINLYVLRLILQPIVENSILHGLSEKEVAGQIYIKGYQLENEDKLIFEIRDNGIGMNEEQIKKVLSTEMKGHSGFNSIGVLNVDRRIKLNYGSQYGINIESSYGEYTNIKIVLPVILEPNEEN